MPAPKHQPEAAGLWPLQWPLSRHARRVAKHLALETVALLVVLNIGMLMLVQDRLPPFTRVGGQSLGLLSTEEAGQVLQERFGSQQIVLTTKGKQRPVTLSEVGVAVDSAATLEKTPNSWWRLLPLFNTVRAALHEPQLRYRADEAKLETYLGRVVKDSSVEPVNTTVRIDSRAGHAVVVPGRNGSELNVDVAKQLVLDQLAQGHLEIALEPVPVLPKRSLAEADQARAEAERLLTRSVTVHAGEQAVVVPAKQVYKFVYIKESKSGELTADIKTSAVRGYLRKEVAPLVYDAGRSEESWFEDGRRVKHRKGRPGETLNLKEASANVREALLLGLTEPVAMPIAEFTPTPITHGTYTRSSQGLATLIQDFVSTHGGDYQVVIRELNGPQIHASYHQDVSTVPASTFKLFLAYAALHQIERNKLEFSSSTSYGSVRKCIEDMIHYSTNPPALALLSKIGYAKVDQILHDAGFTATRLNNSAGGYMATTVRDEADILEGLYRGELLSTKNRDYLLGMMSSQMWRDGIPAGSHGASVADKVGFLDSWTHDVGIVYSPGGTYILAVTTTNSSFYNISLLADQVYQVFNK